jgi:4-amino-4-deoxy-L-arabinose transferase-like glycosyltransferase
MGAGARDRDEVTEMLSEKLERSWQTRYTFWIAVIFLFALVVRIVFVAAVPVKPIAGADPRVYDETARNILQTGTAFSVEGYAFRSPLYPYFVAAVYGAFGENQRNVFVAQAVLGALGTVLLFLSLRQLSLFVATLGALLYALHPTMLFYTSQMLTESLYTFLLLLLTYSTFKMLDGKNRWVWMVGATMGLAILCRSEAMPLSALFALGLFLFLSLRWLEKARLLLAVGVVVAIFLAPWLIRNYVLLGTPVLSTEGGITFYLGNNPEATGGYHVPTQPLPNIPSGEVQKNNFYFGQGLSFVANNPLTFLALIVKKQISLWSPNHNLVLDGADILLLPFAVLGLILAWRDRLNWRYFYFLACPIVTVLAVSSVVMGQVRFRTSLYPFLIAFAALAMASLATWLIKGWRAFRRENLSI